MNNGNATASGNAAPPNLSGLLKPEQVPGLQYIAEEQKPRYIQGVTKLWDVINNQQPDTPGYQGALSKLREISQHVRKLMQTNREKMAGAGSAQRGVAQSQNQQVPPANQTQPQGEGSQQQPKPEQFSAQVLQKLETINVLVPPSIIKQRGPEAGPKFVMEMKKNLGVALQNCERADGQLGKLAELSARRVAAGKPLSAQEKSSFDNQVALKQAEKNQSSDKIKLFYKQQEGIRAMLGQAASDGNAQNGQALKQEGNKGVGGVAPASEHQGQAHTVSSALDAARSQANNVPGQSSAASPQKGNGQPQQPPVTEPQNLPPPQSSQTAVNTVKSEAQPHQNQSGALPPHPTASQQPGAGDPQPLRHEDALEKARSYSNGPAYPHNTPQSATHAHPPQHNQRESQPNSHSKMPVPKDLPHVPPQPVSMGQSRPSMSNGPLPVGPIGQPSIHRNPGYVLEGDGERVLSKKKLEELVRQVTGGAGGEGEDGESITAEVEEVKLTRSSFKTNCMLTDIYRSRLCSISPTTSSIKLLPVPANSPSFAHHQPWSFATSN